VHNAHSHSPINLAKDGLTLCAFWIESTKE